MCRLPDMSQLSPCSCSARIMACRTLLVPPVTTTPAPSRLILTASSHCTPHLSRHPISCLHLTGLMPARTAATYRPHTVSPLPPHLRACHAAHSVRCRTYASWWVRPYARSHPPSDPGSTALTAGRYDHSSIHRGVNSSDTSPLRSLHNRVLALHCPRCRTTDGRRDMEGGGGERRPTEDTGEAGSGGQRGTEGGRSDAHTVAPDGRARSEMGGQAGNGPCAIGGGCVGVAQRSDTAAGGMAGEHKGVQQQRTGRYVR